MGLIFNLYIMKKLSLVLLAAMLAGCNIQTSDSIKIGVIAPMSGPAGFFGEEVQAIVSHLQTQLPANVEVIFEDGKCRGGDAVTAFNKLTDIDNVDAIFGGICSPESLAIAPLTNEKQILAVSPTSSSAQIQGASPYLYSLMYDNNLTVNGLVEQAFEFESIAIVSEMSDLSIDIKNGLELAMGERIVASEVFEPTQLDYRNVIESVLNTSPQALILNPAAGANAETLLKQLAEYKDRLEGIQLLTHFPYLKDATRQSSGDISEGMIIVATPLVRDSRIDEIKAATGKEFKGLDDFMIATVTDGLLNLVDVVLESKAKDLDAKDILVSKKLDGIVVDGLQFGNSNMMSGYQSGTYEVINGVATGK